MQRKKNQPNASALTQNFMKRNKRIKDIFNQFGQLAQVKNFLNKSQTELETINNINDISDQKDTLLTIQNELTVKKEQIVKLKNLRLEVEDETVDESIIAEIKKLHTLEQEFIDNNDKIANTIQPEQVKLISQNKQNEEHLEYLNSILNSLNAPSKDIPFQTIDLDKLAEVMNWSDDETMVWQLIQQKQAENAEYGVIYNAINQYMNGNANDDKNKNDLKKLIQNRKNVVSSSLKSDKAKLNLQLTEEKEINSKNKQINDEISKLKKLNLENMLASLKKDRESLLKSITKLNEHIAELDALNVLIVEGIKENKLKEIKLNENKEKDLVLSKKLTSKLTSLSEKQEQLSSRLKTIITLSIWDKNKSFEMQDKMFQKICKNLESDFDILDTINIEIQKISQEFTDLKNKIKDEYTIIPLDLKNQLNLIQNQLSAVKKKQDLIDNVYSEQKREIHALAISHNERRVECEYQGMITSYLRLLPDEGKSTNIIREFHKIVSKLKIEKQSLDLFSETFKYLILLQANLKNESQQQFSNELSIIIEDFESFLEKFFDKRGENCQSDILKIIDRLNNAKIQLSSSIKGLISKYIHFDNDQNIDFIIDSIQICQKAQIDVNKHISCLASSNAFRLEQLNKIIDICIAQGISESDNPIDDSISEKNYRALLTKRDSIYINMFYRNLAKITDVRSVDSELKGLLSRLSEFSKKSVILLPVFVKVFDKIEKISDDSVFMKKPKSEKNIRAILEEFSKYLDQYQVDEINASSQHKNLIFILNSFNKMRIFFDTYTRNQIESLLCFEHVFNIDDKYISESFVTCARMGISIKKSISSITPSFITRLNKHDLANMLFACYLHDANSNSTGHVSKEIVNALFKRSDELFLLEAAKNHQDSNRTKANIVKHMLMSDDRFGNGNEVRDVKLYRYLLQSAYYYKYDLNKKTLNYLLQFINLNTTVIVSKPQEYLYLYLKFVLNDPDIELHLEKQVTAGLPADIVIINNRTKQSFVVEYDGLAYHSYLDADFSITGKPLRENVAHDVLLNNYDYTVLRVTTTDFHYDTMQVVDKDKLDEDDFNNHFHINYRLMEFINLVKGPQVVNLPVADILQGQQLPVNKPITILKKPLNPENKTLEPILSPDNSASGQVVLPSVLSHDKQLPVNHQPIAALKPLNPDCKPYEPTQSAVYNNCTFSNVYPTYQMPYPAYNAQYYPPTGNIPYNPYMQPNAFNPYDTPMSGMNPYVPQVSQYQPYASRNNVNQQHNTQIPPAALLTRNSIFSTQTQGTHPSALPSHKNNRRPF